MDLQGLAAEQALSSSRMARAGAAVTEFESEERGGGVQFGIGKLPLNVGRQRRRAGQLSTFSVTKRQHLPTDGTRSLA